MDDPVTTSASAIEQTAKTIGKGLEIVHDTGGYLRNVFGEVPADLVGVCGGAWLHESHNRLRDKLRRRTEQIIRERDLTQLTQLSPNLAIALISAAQEEGSEELAELFARLLASAMDPKAPTVRRSYIDAVKAMDPPDAIILRYLYQENLSIVHPGITDSEPGVSKTTGTRNISQKIKKREDEVEVSLRHLTSLSFFDCPNTNWVTNSSYREFMRACYPELNPDAS
jgi:hypothetical protein